MDDILKKLLGAKLQKGLTIKIEVPADDTETDLAPVVEDKEEPAPEMEMEAEPVEAEVEPVDPKMAMLEEMARGDEHEVPKEPRTLGERARIKAKEDLKGLKKTKKTE